MIRNTCHFSGRVQGVGFRYSTQGIASDFEVKGYVQNLPDGRVQLEVEGEAAEIERFIKAIKHHMGAFIGDMSIRISPATGEFHDFSVRA
jgi:acylphosphatase